MRAAIRPLAQAAEQTQSQLGYPIIRPAQDRGRPDTDIEGSSAQFVPTEYQFGVATMT